MSDKLSKEGLQSLISYCKLESEQAEMLRASIKRAKIEKLRIRELLSWQGKPSERTYYLLQGQVNILATLTNGERVVLRQVGKDQLLNLEIVLSEWINKYSIIVSSSFIKFIAFDEVETKLITSHIMAELHQKSALRQKEISKRNRQIKQQSRKKKMEENINKLILPDINLQTNRKKSLANLQSNHNEQIMSLKNLPMFSKQLKKSSRSSSINVLKSTQQRYSQPQNIQAANKNILGHLHDQGSKFMQKKLERLKSQRSMSLNEKQLKEIDYSRNEKLFKQNLKNIVKRKLLFERKHFKILTNFKNAPKKQAVEQEDAIKKYEDENPIDNYFLL